MKRKSLTAKDRLRIFTGHDGRCHFCGGKIDATREAWDVSHEIPLELGGDDDDINRQPAHRKCHKAHTANVDIPNIAKAKRREQKHMGIRKPKSRLSNPRFKQKVNREVVYRATGARVRP